MAGWAECHLTSLSPRPKPWLNKADGKGREALVQCQILEEEDLRPAGEVQFVTQNTECGERLAAPMETA